MSNKNDSVSSCPVSGGCDKVACVLGKVGITRSLLITLALLPFSWNGAAFLVNAVVGAWNALAAKVGG